VRQSSEASSWVEIRPQPKTFFILWATSIDEKYMAVALFDNQEKGKFCEKEAKMIVLLLAVHRVKIQK
jgi:hypothetical protein